MTSPIPAEVDVLVVGYGPVGATIAALLGRYGTRTLVIDRSPQMLTAPRAIALDHEALRILQMTGMADDAFRKVAIPFVRMHSPQAGEFARINTAATIDGHPKLVTFFQPELEAALRTQVALYPSVAVKTGVELIRAEEQAHGLHVTLKLSDASEQVIAVKYLVGADGASSTVRQMIGQDFRGKTYSEDWLIVDALNVPHAIDHVEFLCDHRRPTPHMVAPGGRTRWEFMLKPGESREQMERDGTIYALLRRWGSAEEIQIERKAVYRFHARSCARYSKGRIFLAGDAAHITPPFIGQGLVAGLRDAANLSWKLSAVSNCKASPSILQSYDVERRPHATRMIALARHMGKLVMPRNALSAWMIHGALALLRRMPGLRRVLEEKDIKPPHAFTRGLFIRARSLLKRGGLMAQGYVRAADGGILRSDEVLGAQLTLVSLGLDAVPHLATGLRQRWQSLGGTFVQFCQQGQTLNRSENAFEDLHNTMIPKGAHYGWCAVVRPDRIVMTDGPVADVDRVVSEAIALLEAPDTVREAIPRRTPHAV